MIFDLIPMYEYFLLCHVLVIRIRIDKMVSEIIGLGLVACGVIPRIDISSSYFSTRYQQLINTRRVTKSCVQNYCKYL